MLKSLSSQKETLISPMLIHFFPHHVSKKPFKFLNFWTNNKNFIDVVSKAWTTVIQGHKSFQIQEKVKLLKSILKKQFQHTHIQVSLACSKRKRILK